MTPIAAFDPALASGSSLDRGPPSLSTAPAAPTPTANAPAVIVSLGGVASAASVASVGAAKLPEGSPLEVGRTLAAVESANGFLDNYNHFDWAASVKQVGAAQTAIDRARMWAAAQRANTSVASLSSQNSVIPVQGLISTDAMTPGTARKHMTVGDFSFTHNGSVYTITHMKSGLTVGTKDGQYWEAWALGGALTLPNGLPAIGVSMVKPDPLNIVT